MNISKIKDAINLAGSIASLTGISLLWLKSLSPQTRLAYAVPIYLIVSMLSVGLVATAYLLFKFGSELLGGSPGFSPAGQIAYTGIVGGFLLFAVVYLLWVLFFLGAIAVRDAPRAFSFPT